jgi:hypothetical protein
MILVLQIIMTTIQVDDAGNGKVAVKLNRMVAQ